MRFPANRWLVAAVTLFALPVPSQAGQQIFVQKISVSASNPPVLQIETSAPVKPLVQVISNPERLVIDIPDSSPASTLRPLDVEREEVKRVRVGMFSTAPPTTRIVLDLNAPQWYRIVPNATGFSVRVGTASPNANAEDAFNNSSTIGWVSAAIPATRAYGRSDPFVVKRAAPRSNATGATDLRVQFAKGLLEIHARDASLSEVLFQIHKQTGTEIEIPAGTEQNRVAGDFGPAAASEVLAQLLNGTDLNFVMVGSQDSSLPSSVILSHKSPARSEPISSETSPNTSVRAPASTEDISADMAADMEDAPPQQGENVAAPATQPPQPAPTDFQQTQNPQPQN